MSPTPSNPSSDPRRERAEELLADRAAFGLDAAEQAELAQLAGELGLDLQNDALDLAASALAVAMTPAEPMPALLREKLRASAQAFAAATAEPRADGGVPPLRLAPGSNGVRRTPPTSLERFSYKLMAYSGWIAAAASLALAFTFYISRAPSGGGAIAHTPVHQGEPPANDRTGRAMAVMERILRSQDDHAVIVTLSQADDSAGPPAPVGQVYWSGTSNEGVLQLTNLPPVESPGDAYQLWVVDALRDERYPVDAGTFRVEAGRREALIPFSAKLPVAHPRAFAITVERASGNVVSQQPPVAVGAPTPITPAESAQPATSTREALNPVSEPINDEAPPREEMEPPAP